jgi:hypothetical protein
MLLFVDIEGRRFLARTHGHIGLNVFCCYVCLTIVTQYYKIVTIE